MKKTYYIQKDNALRRAQSKIWDALSPFSRIWKSFAEAEEGSSLHLNLKETKVQLEQTAMLMGQAMVSLSHTRQKSVLANMTDDKTAKDLLKNNKEVFEREHTYTNDLLPDEFRDKLQETSKAVGQVMRNLKGTKSRQPFQKGSPHSATVGRGHKSNVQRGRRDGANANGAPQGKEQNLVIFTTLTPSQTPSHPPHFKKDPSRIGYQLKIRGGD